MPTIGSTNLQDTPSAGKLTGAELARQRWEKRVGFVPDGCDEQGRVEAAHAASEIGTEEDRADWGRIIWSRWGNWPQPFDPAEHMVLPRISMSTGEGA